MGRLFLANAVYLQLKGTLGILRRISVTQGWQARWQFCWARFWCVTHCSNLSFTRGTFIHYPLKNKDAFKTTTHGWKRLDNCIQVECSVSWLRCNMSIAELDTEFALKIVVGGVRYRAQRHAIQNTYCHVCENNSTNKFTTSCLRVSYGSAI